MNIVWRETWRRRVWRAQPVRLVEERGDDLVLWHPPGTTAWIPYASDGRKLRIPGQEDWDLREARAPTESLGLVQLGRRWSIWLERDAGGAFAYWYVNFERGSRRTPVGIDLIDEKLDFVVAPDGAVRWKDEDELVAAARLGYLDEGDVRAQAAAVLADPPWPTGWEDWTPDPAWETPSLPEGWNVV